jgi:hypothetical protein
LRDALDDLRRRTGQRPPSRPFPTPADTGRVLRSLREARPPPRSGEHPWIPDPFVDRQHEWRQVISAYVAVDDIDEGRAVFSAAGWPTLDSRHRLVFAETSVESFALPLEAAQAFLDRHREIEISRDALAALTAPQAAMERREIRVGDVFAMSSGALTAMRDPTKVDVPNMLVVDVTRHAREAAKIAFYAAASRTIDPAEPDDRELAETIQAEQQAVGTIGMEQ